MQDKLAFIKTIIAEKKIDKSIQKSFMHHSIKNSNIGEPIHTSL